MKSFVIAFAVLAIAAADVSHLSSRYLPPPPTAGKFSFEGPTTTTIEQQELQELPEQIEYEQQPQTHMDTNQMMQQQPAADVRMPAALYLPPAQQQQAVPLPSQEYLAPIEQPAMEPMPAQEYIAPEQSMSPMMMQSEMMQEQRLSAGQYLPPAMDMQVSQPTYQQYQEQLLREQMEQMPQMEQQQIMEVMPIAADHEQMEQMEAEPAHMLTEDGYHYKTGGNDARFRLRH